MAADGLITIPSSGTVKATLDRLEKRGQSLRHHSLRTDRSCSGRGVGRARHASDGTADLRQCDRRHAADAGNPDDRHRSAAQGAGMGRCVGAGVAVVQRSGLACVSSRARRVVRRRDRCHDCDAREHRAKSRGRAVAHERLVGVGHRSIGGWRVLTALTSEPWLASVLNLCCRDLILCSIDLTRCSTDLIPCSVA